MEGEEGSEQILPTFCSNSVWMIANYHFVFCTVFLATSAMVMGLSRLMIISKHKSSPNPTDDPPISETKHREAPFGRGDDELSKSQAHTPIPAQGMVSLVLPCKGVHDRTLENWQSRLRCRYTGSLEYIFVVESDKDPAHAAASQLQGQVEEASEADQLEGTDENGERFRRYSTGTAAGSRVKVVVAGKSFHNSQKIHNMLSGIGATDPNSEYVLFLDDDIQCHTTTISDMVGELCDDPSVFCSTGYAVELPSPKPYFSAFLIMIHRFINLMAFNNTRPAYVWGGCMMLRKRDIDNNTWGLMDSWRDGGYSEDLITSAMIRLKRRQVGCNLKCIFPNVMNGNDHFNTYWNFACRQLYVLDTYCTNYNKLQNYSLAFQQLMSCLWFWLFTPPVIFQLLVIAESIRAQTINEMGWNQCQPWFVSIVIAVAAHFYLYFCFCFMMSTLVKLTNTLSPKTRVALHFNYFQWVLAFIVYVVTMPIAVCAVFVRPSIMWSGVKYEKCKVTYC